MSSLKHIEPLIEYLQRLAPDVWAASYPRRIIPPVGYANPRYFSAVIAGTVLCSVKKQLNQLPEMTGQCVSYQLIKYRVPTFFLSYDFVCAIAATDPPEDMNLVDVKFPLDAMLFVLPDLFVKQYASVYSPFIAIAKAEKGIYPSELLQNRLPRLKNSYGIDNQQNRVTMHYVVFPGNKDALPCEYTGAYNLDKPISTIHDAQFVDSTKHEEEVFNIFPVKENMVEDEKVFNQRMNFLAIKLLLSLDATSEYIEYGTLLRKQKFKHNVIKDELWGPNIIGRTYRIRQPDHFSVGTHASPRTHWRRGFWRRQKYGTALSKMKLIWIEPVLVNVSQTEQVLV